MMLLSHALVRLLRLWDNRLLKDLPEKIQSQIPVVLFQILNQTLRNQESNGSWSQSREISAYSVLTLIYLHAIPWASSLTDNLDTAIASGRKFISASPLAQPENIWIEKVSYGSEVLCQVYCLSALNAVADNTSWKPLVSSLSNFSPKAINGFLQFFSKLPILSEESKWKLRSSLIEGYLFLPLLKKVSHDIFPRGGATEEKYLEYIPLTWTMTNNLCGTQLSANFLKDMMVISMLNFQADEFMEAVVGKDFENDLEPIKVIVHSLCRQSTTQTNGFANGRTKIPKLCNNGDQMGISSEEETPISTKNMPKSLESTRNILQRFIKYVLGHPCVVSSSSHDQFVLRRELEMFLLSHITHIEDNTRFSRQEHSGSTVPFLSPRSTYYNWVHTTSASHTSCSYSFAFVSCLSSTGPDCFPDVFSKYLAEDLCSHLAVMCRQYNDYGSIQRDRVEKNLNSINFPEFHSKQTSGSFDHEVANSELKTTLFEVAEFERGCLLSTMGKLLPRIPSRVADTLKLFVGVTDLYGQIYVARDIGIASRP